MIHILTLMKLSIAPIQIVFKRNNRHFVAYSDVIITLLKFSSKSSSQKMQIFNKDFLKNFLTAEEQKPKLKPQLGQIDSEGHAKYGYSTPNVKRDILKNKWPRVVK